MFLTVTKKHVFGEVIEDGIKEVGRGGVVQEESKEGLSQPVPSIQVPHLPISNHQVIPQASPEINLMVGKIWLWVAREQIALVIVRVESHANIADGPSRNDYSYMQRLNAMEVSPEWPDWIYAIWCLSVSD